MAMRYKILNTAALFTALLLMFICASPLLAEEADPNKFQLDAHSVSYEDSTGIATAEGDVVVSNRDMKVYAPFVEYDAPNERIRAESDTRNHVTLRAGGKTLIGHSLRYNVRTKSGVLTNARGASDAVIFKGGEIEVMPLETAAEKKIISKRTAADGEEDDMLARWSDVTATTCNFKQPHYRLVAKQIIVIPDNKVVLRKPTLYLGKSRIITYPFDQIFWIGKGKGRRRSTLLLPRIGYDSDKSLGVIVGAPYNWETGSVNIEAAYWLKNIWEFRFGVYQRLGRDFTLFAESDRLYNEDMDDTVWRPRWGIKYENRQGWKARLWESERELVKTEVKLGVKRSYTVWRSPEFEVHSPWFKNDAIGGYYRVSAIAGRYQDNVDVVKPWVRRLAAGAEIYAESKVDYGVFKPFYDVAYWYYDYDTGDTQKVTDLTVGVRWNIGDVKLGTAYVRRWVDGQSPLIWDRYYERKNIYQQVGFAIPGGRPWEQWEFNVRAGYDLIENKLAEMVYMVGYNKHCLKWELWARDNRADNDLSVGLRLTINAFPSDPLELGIDKIYSPFRNPVTGEGDELSR
jgi:lipopolysaccharide assembly outer membrane protein LptD (OstA)